MVLTGPQAEHPPESEPESVPWAGPSLLARLVFVAVLTLPCAGAGALAAGFELGWDWSARGALTGTVVAVAVFAPKAAWNPQVSTGGQMMWFAIVGMVALPTFMAESLAQVPTHAGLGCVVGAFAGLIHGGKQTEGKGEISRALAFATIGAFVAFVAGVFLVGSKLEGLELLLLLTIAAAAGALAGGLVGRAIDARSPRRVDLDAEPSPAEGEPKCQGLSAPK